MKAALKEAGKRGVPLVIAFDIPDSMIKEDVRELISEKGKIVFLSLGSRDKEVLELKHRYDLKKPGAVLADEFGNLLKGGLKDSEQIVDAFYEMDELMAELYQSWNRAIEKGMALIKEERYKEAARVLKIFAFASGTKEAEKGKKMFDRVARIASEELELLVADTIDTSAEDLDEKTREELLVKLIEFIEKWPKTTAAFAAEARMRELTSVKGL